MREAIDSIVDRLPDSMPQWFDVPTEVRQQVVQELKAMFPDDGSSRQGVFAQYSKNQVREIIDLTCKTCLEAALECKRAALECTCSE